MLQKIVQIKSIGNFADYSAASDVQFRKLTLLYAENGRGKTTLCDILRSLKTGEAGYINGRRTLGGVDPPEVHFRLAGGSFRFKDGTWSAAHPQLEIYDSTFIHDNVYAGDYVGHDHKKNLYGVIVGAHGVGLARDHEQLDADSRNAQRTITEKRGTVSQLVPSGVTFEAFLTLACDPSVDTKIAEKAKDVAALESAAAIKAKAKLAPLSLPLLPDALAETLGKALDDVSADAERQVQHHVAAVLDDSGRSWLSAGLRYASGSACPFCAQEIEDNDLVGAYRDYFSVEYAKLKEEIAGLDADTETSLGHSRQLVIQGAITSNTALATFWSDFVGCDIPDVPFEEVQSTLDELRNSARSLLAAKAGAPLDPLEFTDELRAALSAHESLSNTVRAHNAGVESVNASIDAQKMKTSTGDIEAERRALQTLRATKVRHGKQAIDACELYQSALTEKATIEEEKSKTKTALDQHSTRVLRRCETHINEILDVFGAGFRLVDVDRRYAGGAPSSTYRLLINDVPVDLGDPRTPLDSPAFKNTLSSGDRSTLALAFFLAKLHSDPDLAQKTCVFDDPFNSQDLSRRTRTQEQICKLLDKAGQVVVLSHDPAFLKLIWNERGSTECKALQLFRLGARNTGISEWDISEATRGEYFENHKALGKYLHEGTGEARHIVRCIRPLLEKYLRFKLPRQFEDNHWLGDMIGAIRDADKESPIAQAKAILDDLVSINQFSKKYHHDQNPAGADTEALADGELTSYVRNTLDLVGGF